MRVPDPEIHPRRRSGGSDRGSGSVVALLVVAVIGVLIGWLGLLAQAQVARGTAQAAADLGALAGATAARSADDPCARAAEVVRRNRADPGSCELVGAGQVRVSASVRTVMGTATAQARAGPASARTGGP
ncbi:Rv3654c family TadE-like protein [Cellulomonas sp. NPDC089187]|uniref:Rv3654c family TadE-like protein n=1 Tax=Cellulomonas sp. NPDC089187 TaxID=3154970 RepID=UPI00341F8907